MTYAVSSYQEHTEGERARAHRSRQQIQQRPAAARWAPQPTMQAVAYACDADQIGYGGAADADKSDLILGFAGTRHRRSLVMRRVFPPLRALIERSREIYNADGSSHADDSFNEQLHRWRLHDANGERLIKAYWIRCWPLGLDASITPPPAEPRNAVLPLKSLLAQGPIIVIP